MRDERIVVLQTQLSMLQRRLRSELTAVQGLSRTLLRVLGAIERLADGATPSRVAEDLQMTSSNVAAALRELEAGGSIRRRRDPDDARRVLLFLTDRGSAVVAQFRAERDTWFGRAVGSALTRREQQELFAAGRLLQRLAEYDPAASTGHR
jgi:DNA-binding MarR family transcriptional regulator